jgi:integrase
MQNIVVEEYVGNNNLRRRTLERRRLGYSDVMSESEIEDIIDRSLRLDYLISGEAWATLFSIFWAYGKRVSEVCELSYSDIAVSGKSLVITFQVRKKRGGVRPRMSKRLTRRNPYAMRIERYWRAGKEKGGYLFPRPRTKTGHINRQYVSKAISKLGLPQPVTTHLFRHTLATKLADYKVGAFELKSWFDWEKIDTADSYVSASGVSTRRTSGRTW